jgi:GT2 family glycosyltransferase
LTGISIVILNWNNWRDTIECLESVFKINYPDYRVIVVDNGSTDGSIDRILEWAHGSRLCSPIYSGLQHLVDPPVLKPVPCLIHDVNTFLPENDPAPFILLKTGINLGFAGGNNAALRYLMGQEWWRYVWLLNNDTIVAPDALSALVLRMAESPQAGMCGSLLPYYDKPDIIWAQGGGFFNRWFSRSGCIGNGLPLVKGFARNEVERRMKYVAGASLLVSRAFIDEVGLMCEDYFLYFEEPDWAFRGNHSFTLAYAPESIVYHKVGMSTHKGVQPNAGIDSPEDYIFRNSLKFTRKFFPVALPSVFIRVSFNRIKAWFGHFIQRIRRSSCG